MTEINQSLPHNINRGPSKVFKHTRKKGIPLQPDTPQTHGQTPRQPAIPQAPTRKV